MSHFQCSFQSKVLLVPANVTVVLPFPAFDPAFSDASLDEIYGDGKKFKTLYLLHGAFADAGVLSMFGRLEEYAQRHGLAVVMPSVGNSFYADLQHGPDYFTYVTEELPRFVQSVFPLSPKREDNFVAGFSMGGYGAFKVALNKPKQFAAGISISGVLDLVTVMKNPIHPVFNVDDYYGGFDKLKRSGSDLFAQLLKLKQSGATIPDLYMACGLEDNLYDMNVKFRDLAHENSIPLTFEDGPGAHTSDFLDQFMYRGLEWLAQNLLPAE